MSLDVDIALREGFDKQPGLPELYDQVRPRYPDGLFDALETQTGLARGDKLLEIGPGPGTATLPLAERGYAITAVELSPKMAKTALDRLAVYPGVRILTGSFEDVDLPAESFDLVFAAATFHWVKPEVRFAKSHDLLKSTGHIAIIHANYLSGGRGDAFYKASQPIYDEYAPGTNVNWVNMTAEPQDDLPKREDIQPASLDAELFEQAYFKVFSKYLTFSSREYAELLGTFSTNLALSEKKRAQFLAAMGALIDNRFGGRVSWHYGMSLTIGQKKPATEEQP